MKAVFSFLGKKKKKKSQEIQKTKEKTKSDTWIKFVFRF